MTSTRIGEGRSFPPCPLFKLYLFHSHFVGVGVSGGGRGVLGGGGAGGGGSFVVLVGGFGGGGGGWGGGVGVGLGGVVLGFLVWGCLWGYWDPVEESLVPFLPTYSPFDSLAGGGFLQSYCRPFNLSGGLTDVT